MQVTKLVIDTNILVSASISTGRFYDILKLFLDEPGRFEFCVSEPVLDEYKAVSGYIRIQKKFPHFGKKMLHLIEAVETVGSNYFPKLTVEVIKDVSDNRFLELAFSANAHYLITGNHLDFNISKFHNTKIVSPKAFWDLYLADQL
ncbi:MAG: putative toxin-antitoxin system toxin component, PIN family [Chitinophagaceae bacterium]